MASMIQDQKLWPINLVARRLRVPVGWLKSEAEANRIPHLRAGRAILANVDAVESVLLKRARGDDAN